LGVHVLAGAGNFLFTATSRWLWGPPSLLSKGYQGLFPLGVKQPRYEADHSPQSIAKVTECMELYLHTPVHLHGVVLSSSTGTTLPVPDQIKEDEMSRACSMHGRDEKCIQYFDWKT